MTICVPCGGLLFSANRMLVRPLGPKMIRGGPPLASVSTGSTTTATKADAAWTPGKAGRVILSSPFHGVGRTKEEPAPEVSTLTVVMV